MSRLLLIWLVATVVCAWSATAADSPLTRHPLLSGITAEIQPDGSLTILSADSGLELLGAGVPALESARRTRWRDKGPLIFRDSLAEGVAGGRRGFSAGADDDGDGLVDEDRRDGRDNDGDGLVDEDFAAISDEMTVVHRREGTASVHQELYHWSYPGLRSAVFLSLASDRLDPVAWQVQARDARWVETDVTALHHSATGKPMSRQKHLFVTRLDGASLQGAAPADLWLGVMVLGDRPGYLVQGEEDFRRLEFPLSRTPLPVVVAAAPSWWQLSRLLSQADRVYRGMADPLNERRAGWIVPPDCALCRTAAVPAFSIVRPDGSTLVVQMHLEPGQSPLVDPDLFLLGGQPLGAPSAIVWRDAGGDETSLPWSDVGLGDLSDPLRDLQLPYLQLPGLDGHLASGVLEFRYAAAGTVGGAGPVSGSWLDGRSFVAELAAPGRPMVEALDPAEENVPIPLTDPGSAADEDAARVTLDDDHHPPVLSSDLLESWPNPFRDVISIRFKVPETVGEAFQWVDPEDRPKNLDLQASVPWTGGSPSASVKIYNIHGQEVKTLHDGMVSQGQVTVSWNGTDIYGRQVASGTYLCKLQLDEWSVTRRLIYLR